MTTLVDTSVLIDHLRGHQEAAEALRSVVQQGRRVTASVVTKVEVLAGMRASEEEATRSLFRAVSGLPLMTTSPNAQGNWPTSSCSPIQVSIRSTTSSLRRRIS